MVFLKYIWVLQKLLKKYSNMVIVVVDSTIHMWTSATLHSITTSYWSFLQYISKTLSPLDFKSLNHHKNDKGCSEWEAVARNITFHFQYKQGWEIQMWYRFLHFQVPSIVWSSSLHQYTRYMLFNSWRVMLNFLVSFCTQDGTPRLHFTDQIRIFYMFLVIS